MKLGIEHLAPYADKGCKYSTREGTVLHFDFEDMYDIQQHIKHHEDDEWMINYKLHLRPLSDLVKESEHNGEKFFPSGSFGHKLQGHLIEGELENMAENNYCDGFLSWFVMEKLIEWRFDVFGLIDKGYAIDINTVG